MVSADVKYAGVRERKVSGSSTPKNFVKKLNRAAAAALDACTAQQRSFIELANEFPRHVRES